MSYKVRNRLQLRFLVLFQLALAPRITTVPDSTMKVIDEWIYLQLNRGEVSGFQKACNAFKRVNLKDKDADAECLKPFEKRGGADKFIVL